MLFPHIRSFNLSGRSSHRSWSQLFSSDVRFLFQQHNFSFFDVQGVLASFIDTNQAKQDSLCSTMDDVALQMCQLAIVGKMFSFQDIQNKKRHCYFATSIKKTGTVSNNKKAKRIAQTDFCSGCRQNVNLGRSGLGWIFHSRHA